MTQAGLHRAEDLSESSGSQTGPVNHENTVKDKDGVNGLGELMGEDVVAIPVQKSGAEESTGSIGKDEETGCDLEPAG